MGATKSFYSFVGLTLLALSAGAQGAAELSAVGWDDQSHLRVETRGAPEIAVQRLQDGHRLRLTLRETQLGSSAADIGGQGNVKGVFPYQAEDGRSVHIDILLREPGFLTPEATKYGYRLALAKGNGPRATAQGTFATAALASAPAPAANPAAVLPTSQETAAAGRNAIESIDYARLPDGGVQIKVKTTRQPDEPGSFSTDKPARIALDFANTANHMGNKTLRVNLGKVESVSAIEVPGRTRVVISLSESATYNAQVEPDGVRILVATALRTVEPGGAPPVMASAVPQSAKPRATTFSTAVTSAPRQVTKVDFRRGPQGDGRVMIGVSDSDIGITVKEDLGELILEFANASVPENLQKRLDVIDFATPVQTIDT
ncbi:MAG: AMIN domain-containing protein, partial [Gammaproteobacteria bacterium]|nr:AMIN domain-containing protein [Gammaproteobacteria bacterium]